MAPCVELDPFSDEISRKEFTLSTLRISVAMPEGLYGSLQRVTFSWKPPKLT